MKKYIYPVLVLFTLSCTPKIKPANEVKGCIDTLLTEWHLDAANGRLEAYFSKMTEDAYFIGTDASEKWLAPEFKAFCEPHFADGNGWDFKTIKREIYLNDRQDVAWFDEQLDTWMGVCMSSGVLIKIKNNWKIKHYQLSMAVPNDVVQDVMNIINSKEEDE